jgi:hypothetical protein
MFCFVLINKVKCWFRPSGDGLTLRRSRYYAELIHLSAELNTVFGLILVGDLCGDVCW